MTNESDSFETADEFARVCEGGIERCRQLPSQYNPTAWITMMHRYGAVKGPQRLLTNGDMRSGFERLAREGHPELTIEWIVREQRWSRLFDDRDRVAASWRLEQAALIATGMADLTVDASTRTFALCPVAGSNP